MTSNVPFEKNKMASTLAASVIIIQCSQNARRLSAELNLKKIDCAVEKKLKKCNEFYLGKKLFANFIRQQMS